MDQTRRLSLHERPRQTGSVLIVALISILSVAGIAAATNALLTQDAATSTEHTRQIQGITIADTFRHWVHDNGYSPSAGNSLAATLYSGNDTIGVITEKESDSKWYNGSASVGDIEYGYSFSRGAEEIPVTEDLTKAAPGAAKYCQTAINDSEISIICDLRNESVAFSSPWLINGGTRPVHFEVKLRNTDLTFKDDVVLKGSDVEIRIEDSRNSPILFEGALVGGALSGDAELSIKSLRNRFIKIDEGILIEGAQATFLLEDIRNMPVEVNGPIVINASESSAEALFKNLQNRSLTVSGPFLASGAGAELKVEDFRNTTTTFGDSFTVQGREGEASTEFKSFINRRLVFRGISILEGNNTELLIEDIRNAQLEWDKKVQHEAAEEAVFSIQSMRNKTIDMAGAFLLTGKKTKMELDDLRNVSASFGTPAILSAANDSATFATRSMRNKSTRLDGDFWIQGQPAEISLEGLQWHDTTFDDEILVAPDDLAIIREGSGTLTIGSDQEFGDYETEAASTEFGAVRRRDASDFAALIDSEKKPTPTAQEIQNTMDYPSSGSGGVSSVKRRAVR
ncbi:hypothetical protein [Spiribacter roseus]|uniref:Type 4 fimbrial biogenesis protein PilX N-terminal domain-containing protein n=1 Tax=Spiribacter roseus TaxID=1855875 RepID=A0ABV3RXB7_9GAMM